MSNPTRSRVYRHTQGIDYLGNLPGANRALDTLDVRVIEGEVVLAEGVQVEAVVESIDIAEQRDRHLGIVRLDDDHATVDVDSLPTVDIETLPAVEIDDLPAVVVESLPTVEVEALPDQDVASLDNSTLAADGAVSLDVTARGVRRLRGVVSSSGQYDVGVTWLTEQGTELETVNLETDVAGGEPTTLDEPALTTRAEVTVTDKSSGEQTVSGEVQLA